MTTADLMLVDGHNLLYRSFYGFPSRIYARDCETDRTGVFGFTALLRKAQRQHALVHEIVVVFDSETGAGERRELDATYKAQRPEPEPGLFESLDLIKQALDAVAVRWIEHAGAEADDVIASLASRARTQDRGVQIMSVDKDFYQLLGDAKIQLLNTGMAEHRRHTAAADVFARFHVQPVQWPDFRALMGDPADNIPGIRGIGPRTAARLLAGGRHLEQITSEAIKPAWRDQWPDALRWREMIRLRDCKDQLPEDLPSGWATPPLPAAHDLLTTLNLW
jgi:DNA polymerase-1